jgi:pimeloyl-ACP methyl ester carboxylesterase
MKTLRPLNISASRGLLLDGVECGDPAGVPLVLLHGLTDSWRAFEPLLAVLPDHFRSIALSLRGHGESPKPASGFAPATCAEDVGAALDALGCGPALVLGHSFSTLVAQRLALDRPDLVAGLILIGLFVAPARNPLVIDIGAEFAQLTDPLSLDYVRAWQEGASSPDLAPAFLATVISESLKVPARFWHDGAATMLATDLSAEIGRIAAPVLAITGADDPFSTPEAVILEAAVPGATSVRLTGFGHAPHWQAPEIVAPMIVRFSGQLGQTARPGTQPAAQTRRKDQPAGDLIPAAHP